MDNILVLQMIGSSRFGLLARGNAMRGSGVLLRAASSAAPVSNSSSWNSSS